MAVSRSVVGALALMVLWAVSAGAQSRDSLHYLSKQCNEDAIALHLDPGPIQAFLGPGFPLKLEDGKARVVIVAHDCSQYWMDGEDVGPTQEVQVWVSIQGAEDVRPVVGAEQTLPTKTWFSLFSGSTNARVRAAKRASGTAQTSIEGVSLEALGTRRHGRISLTGHLQYSWEVSDAKPLSRLIGMNQDVYVRDSAGTIVLNRTQVLLHLSAGPSQATLTVTGGTDLVPLIRAGTYAAQLTSFFPMWSRATLGNAPSR